MFSFGLREFTCLNVIKLRKCSILNNRERYG